MECIGLANFLGFEITDLGPGKVTAVKPRYEQNTTHGLLSLSLLKSSSIKIKKTICGRGSHSTDPFEVTDGKDQLPS